MLENAVMVMVVSTYVPSLGAIVSKLLNVLLTLKRAQGVSPGHIIGTCHLNRQRKS